MREIDNLQLYYFLPASTKVDINYNAAIETL
jgi:hypothetical protein